MNEERPEERQVETDTQLSAMFDGELPAAECELLARRLTRDEGLRSQWSRYSMIGAAMRAERGVALHDRLAQRVQAALVQDLTFSDSANLAGATAAAQEKRTSAGFMRFARPLMGMGIAASVATLSIFWLRAQESSEPVLAINPVPSSVVMAPESIGSTVALNSMAASAAPSRVAEERTSNGEPERYVTPAVSSQLSLAPQARLANYVVAHSEYSGPLSRRMALLGLVASETAIEAAPAESAAPGAANTALPAAGAPDAQ